MKECIGIRFTELNSMYVDLYLAEAQTENYPYAVYTYTVTPVYTKDGIHHYDASLNVIVYAKELDRVNSIVEHINTAVAYDMNDGRFASRKQSDNTDCVNEVWARELSFTIKQYR